ncbi:hypothetical protein [Helicobacter suis]|uniref:hypothetical protein n=1 Tax=Helicobacter suis TaxID=104628 RepID=UPI0013D20E08|nr:hypothetical protein [Helicobacter suis]
MVDMTHSDLILSAVDQLIAQYKGLSYQNIHEVLPRVFKMVASQADPTHTTQAQG